ncbi:MAG: hypothetical protein ABID63_12230 [Pseudomonadota bacterium]
MRNMLSLRKLKTQCALLTLVVVGAYAPSVLAADPTPPVPFETLFATERGDAKLLRFNAFSGDIPGKRIKALLQSGPVIGDRVLLAEDVAVYFPDGYIVQSQANLQKYVPKLGLAPEHVDERDDLQENPRYRLVEQFGRFLGPECARVEYANGFAALRIKSDGVVSLVTETPGIFDPLIDEKTVTYNVTSAVQPDFIGNRGLMPELMQKCGRG